MWGIEYVIPKTYPWSLTLNPDKSTVCKSRRGSALDFMGYLLDFGFVGSSVVLQEALIPILHRASFKTRGFEAGSHAKVFKWTD
jgi:hypothetical protein